MQMKEEQEQEEYDTWEKELSEFEDEKKSSFKFCESVYEKLSGIH